MSDSSTTTTIGATSSSTRLPLAELPATVLPGAVITLALVTDQLRRAVETARRDGDGRVLLRAGDDQLAVVAQVPDIGSLPTGEPVAIVHVEARARVAAVHTSERGATYGDAEILRDPRPTPASRASPATCAACSSRSPSCAALGACPSCCARASSPARSPTGS